MSEAAQAQTQAQTMGFQAEVKQLLPRWPSRSTDEQTSPATADPSNPYAPGHSRPSTT